MPRLRESRNKLMGATGNPRERNKTNFKIKLQLEPTKFACPAHVSLGHGGKHAPVPTRIGIRQIGARKAATKSQMIFHGRSGIQTGRQITQASPIGQLGKTKRQKMIEHRPPPWPSPQGMQGGATRKSFRMQTRHDLGKYRAGSRHSSSYQNYCAKVAHIAMPHKHIVIIMCCCILAPLNWTAVGLTWFDPRNERLDGLARAMLSGFTWFYPNRLGALSRDAGSGDPACNQRVGSAKG